MSRNRKGIGRSAARCLRAIAERLDPQPLIAEHTERGGLVISCQGVDITRLEPVRPSDGKPIDPSAVAG
ncbi:MAG: hypothetical protein J2P39_08180 [Candidatus Dormibacteraeota bacterium]|nr:hypothetical protein [Candidatus Dormibacteraeota bacterium]